MSSEATIILPDRHTATAIVVLPDGSVPVEVADLTGMPPTPVPQGDPCVAQLDLLDGGTNQFMIGNVVGQTAYREVFEVPTESAPFPTPATIRSLQAKYLQAMRTRVTTEQGREIESNVAVQADVYAAMTNTTMTFDGERGRYVAAVALNPTLDDADHLGQMRLVPPASLAAQEAFYGKVASEVIFKGSKGGGGIDLWRAQLDALEAERLGPIAQYRANAPAYLRAHLWEGAYYIGCASPYNYESFRMGDRNRWKVTREPDFFAPEVEPRALDVTRHRSPRVRVRLVPRQHRYVLQWVAVYMLAAGPYIVIQRFYSTASFSLRAMGFPVPFVPNPAVPVTFQVNEGESKRLRLTAAAARLIRQDVAYTRGFFPKWLLARDQGRFAVYTIPYRPAGLLCGVVDFLDPEETQTFYAWLRDEEGVGKNAERLLVDGYFDDNVEPPVVPWMPHYQKPGASTYTATMGDGI